MSEIDRKSTAMLIDELITTSMKCWYAQEDMMVDDDHASAKAGRKAQLLNARRNQLITAIDKRLGEESITPTGKTYFK